MTELQIENIVNYVLDEMDKGYKVGEVLGDEEDGTESDVVVTLVDKGLTDSQVLFFNKCSKFLSVSDIRNKVAAFNQIDNLTLENKEVYLDSLSK